MFDTLMLMHRKGLKCSELYYTGLRVYLYVCVCFWIGVLGGDVSLYVHT